MKVLFLQEYVRENHMKDVGNGQFKNVFFSTKAGKILKDLADTGLKLNKEDYYIDYAFQQVPKVIARDKYGRATKYKPPKQTEANAEYPHLYERIIQEKPDIIVPTGNIGCKALLGQSSISKLRGVPEKVTVRSKADTKENRITDELRLVELQKQLEWAEEELDAHKLAYPPERMTGGVQNDRNLIEAKISRLVSKISDENGEDSHECWVLPMYSMEFMLINPNIQNLVEADFGTLQKFLNQGEKAFEAEDVDYEFVDNIDRVKTIFETEIPQAPVVCWDLETNTLHPELDGAKPLVITLSWREGTGCTIPLEHKDFTWPGMQLDMIYGYIKQFVADPKIVKVTHNGQYDIRFLRLTKGFTLFRNNRDTKVMYYLLVNQDVESSIKLSDLAYELTDMGGYDKPLEDFKVQYQKDYVASEKERIQQLKDDYKAAVDKEKQLAKEEGRKADPPPKPDFPKAAKRVNEIDGSDFNYEWIPLVETLHPYASGDVDCGLRIHNKLDAIGQKPDNQRLRELYTKHYTELISYLAKIEANGVKLNREYNEGLQAAYLEEEERIIEEMRKFPEVREVESQYEELYQIGLEEWAKPKSARDTEKAKLRDKYKKKLRFNPNSSDDKKILLFKIMGLTLPYNKEYITESAFTDGIPEDEIEWHHYRTDKTALGYIKDEYENASKLADLLLTFSLVKTRRQNFTYKLLGMVDQKGFLHGGFNSTGTSTTRLSSSSPNLQQMPRKTGDPRRFDYKYPIKRMFETSFEGGAVIQLDYSSLESRVLALAARDDAMTQAFLDGADIHRETASLVFGVPQDKITDDQRSSAKSTTFGIAYGETPYSYYSKHGMTLEEAEKLFEDFFRNKPSIKQFIDDTHEEVLKKGYVECLHGYRRNLRNVYSQDKQKKNEALRQSVNTKIQGSGAFLTNSSVVYIQKWLEVNNMRSKVIMTVHDSVVMDCPPEEVHAVAQAAKHIMENLPIDWLFIDWKGDKLRYPIKADVEIGQNYNDMVDYEKEELETFASIAGYCNYKLAKKKIKNYKDEGLIEEEKAEALNEKIESQKQAYQQAV